MGSYKKILSAVIVAIMLFSLAIALSVKTIEAQGEVDEEYITITGWGSPYSFSYYTLYPYELKGVKIGISKYGELINGDENIGLEYGGEVDPFAAPAGSDIGSIPKNLWLQGWMIWIEYDHVTWGHRAVWAAAMFADGTAWGGSWLRVDFGADDYDPDGSEGDTGGYVHFEDFTDAGKPYDPSNPLVYTGDLSYGGRKTNGTAITKPMKVIYHGPRKAIVETSTVIYDYKPGMVDPFAYPLVEVKFTFIFDKVKKQVIILKDVKSLLPNKVGTQMKIQLSNRGEVDLGTEEEGYSSYFHFYTIGTGTDDSEALAVATVYNSSWTICKTEDPEETGYIGYSAAGPFPQDKIASSYGMTRDATVATFDVFQAINERTGHVFWAAFWPSLSDWCADGWSYPGADVWWRAMYASDHHYIDASPNRVGGEPVIPFYVGEWDFILGYEGDTVLPTQFRAVTVYGVTDLDEADDANMGDGHTNAIEDEALNYLLKQVFWPWDLLKVVNKDTARLVNFFVGDGVTTTFELYWPSDLRLVDPDGDGLVGDDFWYVEDDAWDDYSTFSERVLVDGVLMVRGIDYIVTEDGVIEFTSPPPPGSTIKVLFSVDNIRQKIGPGIGDFIPYDGAWEWIIVGRDSDPVDSIGAAMVSEFFLEKNMTVIMSALDMQDVPYHPLVPYIFSKIGGVEDTRGSRDAYRDGALGPNSGRSAIKDDWCKHVPISSANIIVVGGPLANLGAEYLNDFTEGFYGTAGLTSPDLEGKLIALTCWSKDAFSGEGYALIATHKDLNGTVWFEVWGMTGQDTYYASWWLWRTYYGYRIMDILPPGVTSLIISFDYELHPTEECFWKVEEALGTISEVNLADLPAFSEWPDKLPKIHPDP